MSSIRSYFMARFYDAVMKKCERLCLGAWRAELLAKTGGDVLEIGAGTGANLPYYPTSVKRLVLSEPEPHMRKQLQRRLEASGKSQVEMIDCGAGRLDVPDASVDGVVSTFVLCSVGDQMTSLREIYRVLRPGGGLFFIEHVLAVDNPRLVKWQQRFEPLWRFMCCNCHLTRETARAIQNAGFVIDQLERIAAQGAPPVVRSGIKGIARKPGI